jgi:hypothetical protein
MHWALAAHIERNADVIRESNARTRIASAALFALSLVAIDAGTAHASGIVCPVAYASAVTLNAGCQIGGDHNDFLAPLQVNEDSLFGYDDWVFAGKAVGTSTDEPVIDIGFGATGNGLGGEWFVDDDLWTGLGIANLMIVMKGGAANQPGGFLAFLIETGETEGTYVSPFVNLRNPTVLTGISHLSAYVRQDEGEDVPEPASLALVGIGLLAAAARLRRGSRA